MKQTTLALTGEIKGEAKYQRLAQSFQRAIRAGELKPGDRLPSFPQMRELYGATPATVERVYKVLEQDGLIRRAKGRGIFVAEPQDRAATGIIGCISSALTDAHPDPYWAHLMSGIRQGVRETGSQLLLIDCVEHCQWEKIDGVILVATASRDILNLPPGLAGVSLLYAGEKMPGIVADDEQGGYLAARHLIELGHRRIATMMVASPFAATRLHGFERAMAEFGIDNSPIRHREERWPDSSEYQSYVLSGYKLMKQWLSEDWSELKCTALVLHNDLMALGVLRALQEAGYQVPRDVSLVGFDGTEVSEYCFPTLTTVRVPLESMGKKAVELLVSRMALSADLGTFDDPGTGGQLDRTVLEVTLHRGGSTGQVTQ